MEKIQFYINGSKSKSKRSLLKEIREVFQLSNDLDLNNLDVLDDVLDGGYGLINSDEIIEVNIHNSKSLIRNLTNKDVKEVYDILKNKRFVEINLK